MRKLILTLIVILLAISYAVMGHVFAEPLESPVDYVLESQTQGQDIKRIEKSLKESMHKDIAQILPDFNPESIIGDMARGKFSWNLKEIPGRILKYLTAEVRLQLGILVKLVVIAFIFALLKNLQESFMSENIGELAFFACYAAMVALIAVSFKQVLELARGILNNIDDFINIAVPSLIALLVSSGNFVSGATFQPLLIFALQATCRILKDVLLPLIFMSSILFIIDGISDRIKINKLALLFRKITVWTLSILLTFYVSAVTLQGVSGAVIDGVTTKTTKFALSTFIPVAGKYLSDAADTVIGCALIVKNSAGFATMIGMIAIALIPLLKILSITLMYKFVGVIVEPVVEERISDSLNEVSECMTVVLGIVASALFMFMLSVAAVIGAGSISAMMQ